MTLLWSDMTADSLFVFEGLKIFGRSGSDCQNCVWISSFSLSEVWLLRQHSPAAPSTETT